MPPFTKSFAVLLGLSTFGFTSYLLYVLLKKDKEDLLDGSVASTKYTYLDVTVPKEIVRGLIGRNGSNIKQIEQQSNARIHFKDKEETHDRICVIRGSSDACNIAYNLIQDYINNQPLIELEDMFVPPACVKFVIGKNGDRIHEIQCLSGAKLTIVQSKVTIKGTREQINVARSLIEDVVESSLHNQQVIHESLAKREPRLPPKSPDVIHKLETPKSERISPLPGQQENQFEVYVSAMENPSKFWLQIVGPKATELDCLVEEMTEYYNKPESKIQHQLNNVEIGDLVAAIFQYDNKWYRAEVIDTIEKSGEKMATLYYLDYGDTDVMSYKELLELRTDFLRLHFQAIECFLARIEPIGDSWPEEAIDRFEELAQVAQWKKLFAKINCYAAKEKTRAKREGSPTPGVDLYDVTNSGDIDVAEELVKEGLAVYKRGLETKTNSRTTSTSNISVASST
ncbi:hypothetical protein ABEB36_008223 [Hypothenemus hampei]|uniref:Tudor domain-containing protein n=1 Tax=Hypothenemus hampei TaxID=57062 RepID=A0ABD1EQ81_HYPHA